MSVPLSTIYSWFQTGDFPTEAQFQATFSSFFHKDENIPAEKIEGLSQMFQGVATSESVNNHIDDADAHTEHLAKKNAENIDEENAQQWRDKLNIAGTAYVDTAPGADDGNVYNKEQVDVFIDSVNNSITAQARPYKIYRALLQFNMGTFDPNFIVLENEIGEIVWTRLSTGQYQGVLAGAFPRLLTFINSKIQQTVEDFPILCNAQVGTNSTVNLSVFQANAESSMTELSGNVGILEILVYNDPLVEP